MSLIKSISGIRGTIGGTVGDNLSPVDIVKFTALTPLGTKVARARQAIRLWWDVTVAFQGKW